MIVLRMQIAAINATPWEALPEWIRDAYAKGLVGFERDRAVLRRRRRPQWLRLTDWLVMRDGELGFERKARH